MCVTVDGVHKTNPLMQLESVQQTTYPPPLAAAVKKARALGVHTVYRICVHYARARGYAGAPRGSCRVAELREALPQTITAPFRFRLHRRLDHSGADGESTVDEDFVWDPTVGACAADACAAVAVPASVRRGSG